MNKKLIGTITALSLTISLVACSSDKGKDEEATKSNINLSKATKLILDDSAPDTDYTLSAGYLQTAAAKEGTSVEDVIDKITKPVKDVKIAPEECKKPFSTMRLALMPSEEDKTQTSSAIAPNTQQVDIVLREGQLNDKLQNAIDGTNQNCADADYTIESEDENGNQQTTEAKIQAKVKKVGSYKGIDIYQFRNLMKIPNEQGEYTLAADDQTFFSFHRGITAAINGQQSPFDAEYLLHLQLDKLLNYKAPKDDKSQNQKSDTPKPTSSQPKKN